jgi:hypothetical protein
MPSIERLRASLSAEPFEVLAINLAEPRSRIEQFLAQTPLSFPVLRDRDTQTAKAWRARVPGNVGMLGRRYPGYFALGDERALARLMARAGREPEFYRRLRRALAARRALFAPAAERAALATALRGLMHPSGRGSAAARR